VATQDAVASHCSACCSWPAAATPRAVGPAPAPAHFADSPQTTAAAVAGVGAPVAGTMAKCWSGCSGTGLPAR
ncbi:hypothetical protein Q0P46_14035, partial [Staphylococcus aureus]|nr:hypothetical protein [Staphylococcus aureus]